MIAGTDLWKPKTRRFEGGKVVDDMGADESREWTVIGENQVLGYTIEVGGGEVIW